MKRHLRLYSVLVVAQAACLAFGLWLEQRFVLAVAPSPDQPGEDVSEPVAERAAEGGLPEENSAASAGREAGAPPRRKSACWRSLGLPHCRPPLPTWF